MQHLPVSLKLAGCRCLVVGGGIVAERKIELLLRAGADVRIVAARLTDRLVEQAADGAVTVAGGRFRPALLAGCRLVVAATDDGPLNRRVAAAADAAGVFCNVVDDNTLSTFILPAIVDRGPVTVAISTGGRAPVLAQRLKSQFETLLPARLGQLAERAGRWRELVKKRFATLGERRRFWQAFFDGPIAEHLLAGRDARAERAMRESLIDRPAPPAAGVAWLVGAGPGDAGLLTLRGLQLLSRADVVLYDRLVSPAVLDMARKDALRLSVGKRAGERRMTQERINALLIEHVRRGERVCRLKGGDPFVFGRGGEEALALAAAGLPFEIVPGISAAPGCAAYAGIPLTLRGESSSVTFASASLEQGREPDWAVLARPGQTLALYMSIGRLEATARRLIDHGLAATTPAALVADGTTAAQRVLRAPLAEIAARAAAAGFGAPAILFTGPAVAVSPALEWFRPGDGVSDAGFAVAPPTARTAEATMPSRRSRLLTASPASRTRTVSR